VRQLSQIFYYKHLIHFLNVQIDPLFDPFSGLLAIKLPNRIFGHVQSLRPRLSSYSDFASKFKVRPYRFPEIHEIPDFSKTQKADRAPCPVWLRNSLKIKATTKSGQ